MAAVTRLGLYGGPRSLYGSFAGKTPQPEPEPESEISPTGGWSVDPYGYETRRRAALRKEEQEEARKQADEAIARAQESAREALQAKKPRKAALDAAEVSRLIDALERAQEADRRKRLAVVLLLMA